MKLGYSWKIGPFELLEFNIPDGFNWLIKQANLLQLDIPSFIVNKSYINIEKKRFKAQSSKLTEDSKVILLNNSARLVNYLDSLIFIINTKMNCLNNEVFTLLQQAISTAEEKGQNLYIYPENQYFSAGADLKFISACIDSKDFVALEEFLLLGQQTMMKLKYSSINIISCALGGALGGGCEILLNSDFVAAHQELNAGLVEVGVGLIPGWSGIKEMFLRSNGDKNKLIRNLKNIIEQNKTSSADYFALDYYGEQNFKVVMNKNYILDEALQLNLPKKITQPQNTHIILPTINLADELNTESYNELQMEVLSDFQKIINLKEIDENSLLQFERQTFLKLARRKSP
jgi:3-hydroxyacyl-CoA dehydrogenase/enoyl-CoA hydratase/3-hydroxybutyryl-CoA epimerase